MQITISNARHAPKWETLQTIIRETVDGNATLNMIDRLDGGANYNGTGEYELSYSNGVQSIHISLSVTPLEYVAVSLTLTKSERQAIDWIGYRYAHGDDLQRLLWNYCQQSDGAEIEWDSVDDITFTIENDRKREFIRMVFADNCSCFSPELKLKLKSLAWSMQSNDK
jgi:hypothetical protein